MYEEICGGMEEDAKEHLQKTFTVDNNEMVLEKDITDVYKRQLPGVLTSDELFRLKEMPESLVIIGGGMISVEFASVYANLGCKVTIVEAMPRLIPNMDKEISQNLKMILKKRGVDIHTSASVQRVEQEGELYTLSLIHIW